MRGFAQAISSISERYGGKGMIYLHNTASGEQEGDRMTAIYVETFVVKPDKMGEFAAYCKKSAAFMKKRPDLAKEAKSFKRFSHQLGGKYGGVTTMMEFESLADVEKLFTRALADK